MGETRTAAGEIACAACTRRYAWKPELAGRRVRCKCGATMTCPARAPAASTDDGQTYDFAPTRVEPVHGPAPAARLSYRAPKEDAPHVRGDTERIRDVQLPLWLLGGSVAVEVVAALIRRRSLEAAMLHVGLEVVVGTVLMVAGMFVAARLRGLALGNFWNAAFKLSAIAIAPAALVSLLTPILMLLPLLGPLLGLALSFALYFALIGALFDLEHEDIWYCVFVIFLVKLAIYFGLLWALDK